MTLSDKCPTKLLPDTPANDDDFGPHERLADAIADLVTEEEGGKCIGLEGGWGSGKSTVIQLLKKKLAPETNQVVVIDAWAHEGDPLRRTILERLISSLRVWIADEEQQTWDKKAMELACRLHEKKTKTYPLFTKWAQQVMLCTAFVFPLGLAFLNAGLRHNLVLLNPKLPFAWDFMIGAAMVSSPFILIARHWFIAKRNPSLVKSAEAAAEFWSIFVGKFATEESNTTIDTPDPTSVDFERIYRDLMSEVLDDSKKRVVIVLDNLDRIAVKDAASIWSTIQTFLHSQENSGKDWYKRLWVVIPYDRAGIQRLWSDANDLTQSFLDKTFQVRFEVPLPVLSDWRSYFKDKLAEAMPKHDEDAHTVVRFYSSYRGATSSAPTPRAIVNYVNQIGALHRQWADTIPLVDMAAYVLFRQECTSNADFVEHLLHNKFFTGHEDAERIVSDRIGDSLATLVFNVEPRRALQLVLREPIIAAVAARDSTELARLANSFAGFWEVLESLELAHWVTDGQLLSNISYCLVNSGLMQKEDIPREAITVVEDIRRAADEILSLDHLDTAMAEGIAALLQLIKQEQMAESLMSKLTATSIWREQSDVKMGTQWLNGILLFVDCLKEYGFASIYESGITIPNGAEGYFYACLAMSGMEHKHKVTLLPDTDTAALIDYLANEEHLASFASETAIVVQTMLGTKIAVDWANLITAISALLRDLDSEDIERATTLTEILLRLRATSRSNQALNELADEGVIMHWLSVAYDEDDKRSVGFFLAIYLRSCPDASAPTAEHGASEEGYTRAEELFEDPDKEVVEACFANMQKFGFRRHIFTLLTNASSAQSFVAACFRQATESTDGRIAFAPEDVVKHWQLVKPLFKRSMLIQLTKNLLSESKLLDHIIASPYSYDVAALYLDIADAGGLANTAFVSWCVNGLKNLSAQQWAADLPDGGTNTDLLLHLLATDCEINLGEEFYGVLLDHAKACLVSDCRPSELAEKWSLLPRALNSSLRTELSRALCILATSKRGNNIPAGFFKLYGEAMIDERALLGTPDLIAELFIPIVQFKTSKAASRKWLISLFTQLPSFAAKYRPKRDMTDFARKVHKLAHPLIGKGETALIELDELLTPKKQ